jgi:hypothetical protein
MIVGKIQASTANIQKRSKHQDPNTKIQAPEKIQTSSSNIQVSCHNQILERRVGQRIASAQKLNFDV